MGWRPVPELMREVHDGDTSLRCGWPLEYWGLEPYRDNRPDSGIRYASGLSGRLRFRKIRVGVRLPSPTAETLGILGDHTLNAPAGTHTDVERQSKHEQ